MAKACFSFHQSNTADLWLDHLNIKPSRAFTGTGTAHRFIGRCKC